MAYIQPSSVLPAPSHPKAAPGYGKRDAPGQLPPAESDFAHLPKRETEVAWFLDHLDEGSAMGHKPVAAAHPNYGQQAVRTSIQTLTHYGHIRHVRQHLTAANGCMRWVTRTYWSRTPRDDDWWTEFIRSIHGTDVTVLHRSGKVTVPARHGLVQPAQQTGPQEPPAPDDEPQQPETPENNGRLATDPANSDSPGTSSPRTPSRAYRVLAAASTREPRLALSAAECTALEPLAAEWLRRGATDERILDALTTSLPLPVRNPGAIARHRLESKMPPLPMPRPRPEAPPRPVPGSGAVEPEELGEEFRDAVVTRVLIACGTCDADERTAKIVNGLCGDCREEYRAVGGIEEARRRAILAGYADLAWTGITTARLLREKLERKTGGPVPDTFRPVPIADRVAYHYRDNCTRIANGMPPVRWKP